MICLLLNIGYKPEEIYQVLLEIDFSTLVTCDIEDILTDIHFGINSSKPFEYVIRKMMEIKNFNENTTFKELKEKTNQILIITGTCVNTVSLHYFSHKLTPDMKVLDAIQISIAIPFLFKPYKYDNKIWIDGGCMNNYPIDLFHDNLNDMIGIYLDDENKQYTEFDDVQVYFTQVLKCVSKGIDLSKIKLYENQTIHVTCKNQELSNWELKNEHKIDLHNQGYINASKFIEKNYKIIKNQSK